jgi:hypothetical protein
LISVNPELGSHPNKNKKYSSKIIKNFYIFKKNKKKYYIKYKLIKKKININLSTKFFSTIMETKSFFRTSE